MTRLDFAALEPGNRVRFGTIAGTVANAGLNSCGRRFASVEWDGQQMYQRFSYFTVEDKYVRRLKLEEQR